MIEIICRTNLDGYRGEKWPEQVQSAPRVGDWMQAESKRRLRVVEVTHLFSGELEVELHK